MRKPLAVKKMTSKMIDANRQLINGQVVPMGAQGLFKGVGFWEVFQTPNSTWNNGELLSNWNLWHSDPDGIERIPHRALGVDLMTFNAFPTTLLKANEMGRYKIESYWDEAGTLLADRVEKGAVRSGGRKDEHLKLFAPITGISTIGSGEGSTSNEVPQVTLRLTRYPADKASYLFNDFEIMEIYLPPDNYNYLDKT